MLKRILIGLGGTPFTTVAIQRAVELAEEHGARLKAVTVVNPDQICKLGPVPAGAGAYARKMCQNRLEVTQTQVEASVETLQQRCEQSKVPLSIERETGDSFALMIDHARYHDLTIFGLRSLFEYQLAKDPIKDLLRLLSKGVRPIIAVSEKFREIKRVMIAYNGSMESANAMQHFLRMNLWPAAELNIVTVGDDQAKSHQLLSAAADYCSDHGYTAKTHHRTGKAAEELLRSTEQLDIDMVVMGNSARSILVRKVLGDTVLKTLIEVDRPVFLSQ